MIEQPKPCPFCGCEQITFQEGTTFRWLRASCNDCGAMGPEVSVAIVRHEDDPMFLVELREAVVKEWNGRVMQSMK